MNIYFRVDSNSKIGSGHIMRCITLAQKLKLYDHEIFFLCSCDNQSLIKRIKSQGFNFQSINAICPNIKDVKTLVSIIKNSNFQNSWVVLDGYHFNETYHHNIRKAKIKLLVIDDNNHLNNYNADILLNQNIYAKDLNYSCPENTRLLLGLNYFLLRKEFSNFDQIKNRRTSIKKIMITMGGSDEQDITSLVLKSLNTIYDKNFQIIIIVGPMYKKVETLKFLIKNSNHKVTIFNDVENIAELMNDVDFAISSGGGTCYELAYMGIEMGLISIAKNQNRAIAAFKKLGIAIDMGWYNILKSQKVSNQLNMYIKELEKYQRKEKKIELDGKGTERVASEIGKNL